MHVAVSMSAETGGPASVGAGLTAALAQRGHQVTIATLEEPGRTPVTLHPEVRRHAFPRDGAPRYAASRALDAWLRENVPHFDVVHLHAVWQFPTFAAARACWAARVPYVTTPHGMLDAYSVRQNSAHLKRVYWAFREKRVQQGAAAIHCLNPAEIRKAVPWIRPLPKFLLPNGIDQVQLDAMPPRGQFRAAHPQLADRPLALFLSRLHPKKGLERLLPAWRTLAEKMPEARFLIAGTGDADYIATLRQLVATHALTGAVEFLGQLTGAPKWQALVDADVFVLPSHQEGFSMAVTEALAAGTPPVVTEECNFEELVPPPPQPPAGIIINNGDMDAFVGAVADLLADARQRRALADAGVRMVAQRYTWQKIAADLESIYRRILAGERFSPNP